MVTKRKPWPHNAEWARLDAIATAREIASMATDLILIDLDPIEKLRMLTRVKDKSLFIEKVMKEAR